MRSATTAATEGIKEKKEVRANKPPFFDGYLIKNNYFTAAL
jgi:hypothetical protein